MEWIWVSKETLFIRISGFFYVAFHFSLSLHLLSHVHLIMPLSSFAVERLHLPHEIYVAGIIKNHNGIKYVFESHFTVRRAYSVDELLPCDVRDRDASLYSLHDLIPLNEFYNPLNRVRTSLGAYLLRQQKEFLSFTSTDGAV